MDFPEIPILGVVSEDGGDESKEGGLVGGNAGDAGPAFEFLFYPFESVGGARSLSMGDRKGKDGEACRDEDGSIDAMAAETDSLVAGLDETAGSRAGGGGPAGTVSRSDCAAAVPCGGQTWPARLRSGPGKQKAPHEAGLGPGRIRPQWKLWTALPSLRAIIWSWIQR